MSFFFFVRSIKKTKTISFIYFEFFWIFFVFILISIIKAFISRVDFFPPTAKQLYTRLKLSNVTRTGPLSSTRPARIARAEVGDSASETLLELFLVPASAPRLVQQRPWYVLSCLWDDAYKRTLASNRKE